LPEIVCPWLLPDSGAYAHQRYLYESIGADCPSLVGMVTGYGGGKTHSLVRHATRLALRNQPIPVLCIEPTYPMIADILVPAFEELFEEWQIGYKYNENRKRYIVTSIPYKGKRIKTKGVIWMRSGDNPKRLKGPNIAAAFIDEPFIQDEGVLKQARARVRHPRSKDRIVFLTGTSEGLGWGNETLAEKCRLVKSETVQGKTGPVEVQYYEGDGIKFVSTSSEINTALGADYFDNLRASHTDLEIQAYIGGQFINLSQGRVYYAYDRQYDTPYTLRYDLPVMVWCDFNATECPMSWNVAQEHDGLIHVTHALWKQYTNTAAMCEYLYEVLTRDGRPLPRSLIFYGDSSGRNTVSSAANSDWVQIEQFFRQAGKYDREGLQLKYRACRSIRDSAAAANALLQNANGESKLRLVPGPATEHLRKDLELVVWAENGTKEDDKDKMRTHAGSTVRYFADYEYPIITKARRVN